MEDPNFQYLMQHIEDDKASRAKTHISLNMQTRQDEREQNMQRSLELENERRSKLGLEGIASLEDLDVSERPDIHLDQAAEIVTDLALLREIEATPAQAAQVTP